MPWTLSPLETLWCATALAAGYAVRGVAGFGSGIVATPLLAFVLPMTTTAPLITVVGFLVSTRQALRDWRLIQWKAVLSFAPGALVGVPLGLWAVKTADQTMLSRVLGAYVVTYALYSLFGERLLGRAPTMPRWMVHPIGVAGGVISTLFGGLAGPLYVTYFDSQRLAKGAFRVTVSTTLLTLAMVRSAGYLAAGLFRAEDLVLIAAALLPVAVGTAAGEWVHDHIEQQAFRRGIGALLVLSGTALLLR